MKIKEELLKIYSAYLPYELKMQYQETEELGVLQSILNVDESDDARLGISTMFQSDHYWLFKPIFYSMDMLTKEIEHKGERFVPSLEIEKHTITGDTYNWHRVKEENVSILNYEVVAKLLEWHFNVFGLDESEYVQKQSVIQK